MACGAAAVVTGVGGVGEYARHGQTTMVVEPREPQSIADATLMLLDDAASRAAMSAAGLAEARRFDLKLESERTRALMSRLVAKPVERAT
jgi:sucrose-phosphate synthase